jgi:segregation and condensation protein B
MDDNRPIAAFVLDPARAQVSPAETPAPAVHLSSASGGGEVPEREVIPRDVQAGRGASLSLHPGLPAREPDTSTASVIEAVLFAADTPLSANRLAELVGGCGPAAVRAHIEKLNEKYEECGLAFRIEAIAGGFQMMTLAAFRPWLVRLNRQRSETRLSDAALETLAIIAYKQPIIRADVEAIRGVACGEVIGRLREMGLVRIVGRAEIVGRPMLYGTTRRFLDVFGLADLDDLPPMEALKLRPAREPPRSERQRGESRSGEATHRRRRRRARRPPRGPRCGGCVGRSPVQAYGYTRPIMRAYGIVSRICRRPHSQATVRSTPSPKPPWGTLP